MKRTSRLRASLVSRWKTFYAAGPLVRLRPRGTPARSLRRDRTSRPARHRFTARLDARACRGRGSASELVVEVGSPSSTRIELSAWHLLKQSSDFSPTCVDSHSPDDLWAGPDPFGSS